MADDNELKITARVDADQAIEKTEELKASVEGVTAAQTVAADAAAKQAGATAELTAEELRQQAIEDRHILQLREIVEAQREAATSISEMASLAEAGGAKYKAAIDAAASAVTRLEIATKAVQAAGGPVPPAAIAELAAYDAAVQAATASQIKGASSSRIFSEEANLARGNVGGLARALAGAAADGESFTGSLARAALPIAGLVAVASLLPTILEKINTGTKAWAAAIVDTVAGLDEQDSVQRKANESQEAYEARLESTLNTTSDLTRAQIAMAAGLLAVTTDNKAAEAAWQGHEAAMHGALEQYPAFIAALKAMGVSFKATFEEMKQETELFGQAYQFVLRTEGVESANAWAQSNKSSLDKIVSYYQEAGKSVPPELAKIVAAIQLITTAERDAAAKHELKEKFLDTVNAGALLIAQLQASKDVFGNEATAVIGLRKEIDAQIASLEKLKTSNAEDEKTRKDQLASLNALAAIHGTLTGKMGDEASALDKLTLKIVDLSKALDDNRKSFEASLAKIEEHREKSIAAADQIATKTIADLAQQQAAAKASYDAGQIDFSTYVTKINTLIAEQAGVKRKAADEDDAINAEARQQQADLVAKDTEAKDKIKKNLDELGVSLEAAAKIRQAYYEGQKASVAALQEQQAVEAEARVAVDKHAESQRAFATDLKAATVALTDGNVKVTGHKAAHESLHPALSVTQQAMRNLSKLFTDQSTSEIPALNGSIDSLIAKMQGLRDAAQQAAAAVASVTDGGAAPAGP